tara:strand:- start:111 stop:539 length:429 start_codon:yes stop_codon:yes gene_type:complete
MAFLPPVKRISREDLPEAPDWTEKLIYPINLFFESVYRALNGSLTVPDNIAGQIKEISFQVRSDYNGTDTSKWDTLSFQSSLKTKAKGLLVFQLLRVEDSSSFTPIASGVFVDWEDENRTIKINYMTGLTASKKYSLRLKIE